MILNINFIQHFKGVLKYSKLIAILEYLQLQEIIPKAIYLKRKKER